MAISGDGWEILSSWDACGPVGGLHARDQRQNPAWQQAVKGERLTAGARPRIRAKTRVGLTTGFVAGAAVENGRRHGGTPKNAGGRNARKRAARKAAAEKGAA